MVPKQGRVGWEEKTHSKDQPDGPGLKKINLTINNKATFFTNFKSICKLWWDGDLSGTWDSSEEELLCCSVWLRQQCLGTVLRGKLSWELKNRKQMQDTEPKFNLCERKQLCNSGGKGGDKQRYAGSAQATKWPGSHWRNQGGNLKLPGIT